MKNIIVLMFLAFCSQAAFSQQTSATKACCAQGNGKACSMSKGGAGCAHEGAACPMNKQASASNGEMIKKVAVVASNSQTAQFQVWGNCEMCKRTIEKAALAVNGVSAADWNVDTHQISVSFDPSLVKIEQVHQAIAAAGYDTDQVKADNNAYGKLHTCCQYERRPNR